MSQAKVLLLGGGYTLQRVAQKLKPETFVITSRDESRCGEWRNNGWNAEVVSVKDADSFKRVFSEHPSIDTVVDSVPPLKTARPQAGAERISEYATAVGVRRILYLSTTGVFGVTDGSWVSEESPPDPRTPQAEARLLSEEVYRRSNFASLALRLPAIYGPERGTEQALLEGRYRMVDGGVNWTNRIHVEDLATVIAQLLLKDEWPKVLCVSDDEPIQVKDVVGYYCDLHGLEVPPTLSSVEAEKLGHYTLLSNQRVSNELMKQIVLPELRYPTYRHRTESDVA